MRTRSLRRLNLSQPRVDPVMRDPEATPHFGRESTVVHVAPKDCPNADEQCAVEWGQGDSRTYYVGNWSRFIVKPEPLLQDGAYKEHGGGPRDPEDHAAV